MTGKVLSIILIGSQIPLFFPVVRTDVSQACCMAVASAESNAKSFEKVVKRNGPRVIP